MLDTDGCNKKNESCESQINSRDLGKEMRHFALHGLLFLVAVVGRTDFARHRPPSWRFLRQFVGKDPRGPEIHLWSSFRRRRLVLQSRWRHVNWTFHFGKWQFNWIPIDLRFVVMENMRHLLASFDSTKAHYLGSRRHYKSIVRKGYYEGGSGSIIASINFDSISKNYKSKWFRLSADERDDSIVY